VITRLAPWPVPGAPAARHRTPCRDALLAALLAAATASLGGCSRELVVLLPGPDGSVGAVDVSMRGADPVTLDSAYAGAESALLGLDAIAVSEAQVRSDFAQALDAQPPEPVTYVLYFEEGSTEVVPASRTDLARMLRDVQTRVVADIQVTGHTDWVGRVEDNDGLARERATMVRAVLVRQGIDPNAIRASGRGERELLVPTADEVREPRNRRVSVTVR
jgi:outer membrane protein OmpA-like peptidoglycan-associated protein